MDYLSLGIDDMDQNKTAVPKPQSNTKMLSGLLPLKTHVTGVILTNGRLANCRETLLFVNADKFKQGSIHIKISYQIHCI